MKRNDDQVDGIVELGVVTIETKGPPGEGQDAIAQRAVSTGLSHD